MNKNEKTLLKELKEKSEDSELLSHVKKAVDPLGKLRGDFRFKAEIYISVTTLFTEQLGGGAINIILPAGLPPAVQNISFPVYLFGLTDFQGGFNKLNNLFPIAVWQVFARQIVDEAFSNNIAGASGGNCIPVIGDMFVHFHYLVGVNVYDCYMSIHCNNVAYGTFLHSFSSDLIILNSIRYSVPVLQNAQLLNPLLFGIQSLFGKLVIDTIDPRMYVTNQTFNQEISDIPVTLPIDKSLIMGTYLNFDVQNIGFLLTVQKVKPLTLRH